MRYNDKIIPMDKPKEYSMMFFPSPKEWEVWLATEYDKTLGVWIQFAKKGSGIPSLNHQQALEVAICYGWIDGQGKRFDDTYWLVKFTPRGPRSIWSKRNRVIVERLINEKKMQPSGLAKIEQAKQNGQWDNAYDSSTNMVLPQDFLDRLSVNKTAQTFFLTLNKANIYAIGWRLQTAKKPETRERRMQQILTMLESEKKFH